MSHFQGRWLRWPGTRVILYGVTVIGFTWGLADWLFFHTPQYFLYTLKYYGWPLLLMWIPGLLSLLFRLVFREGFRDVGWRVGKQVYWLIAIGVPLTMAAITYGAASLAGAAALRSNLLQSPMFVDIYHILPSAWPGFVGGSITAGLLVKFAVAATLGMVCNFVFAFGEELGWRGYLQTRLVESRLPASLLLCGLIWAAWHLPWLMYAGMQMWLFVAMVALFGVWIGWLRLASGSVWVAAAAHAAHNCFLLTFFATSFTVKHPLWVEEGGWLPVLGYAVVVGVLMWRGRLICQAAAGQDTIVATVEAMR